MASIPAVKAIKRLFARNSSQLCAADVLDQAMRPVIEDLEQRRLLSAAHHHPAPGSAAPVFPHMVLVGAASTTIANGEASPRTLDGTDFGTLDKSKSVVEVFTIKNTGAGVLDLTGFNRVFFTGANASDWTLTSVPPATIQPNAQANFSVKFQPSTTGLETASMVIDNDTDGESPYTVGIQAHGTAAAKMQLTGNGKLILTGDTTKTTADNTSFGSTEAAQGVINETYVIKNTGSAPLTFTGGTPVTVTGDSAFTIPNQPAGPVAPGASVNLVVHFTPGTAAVHNAVISIATNDASSPYTFGVSGTGVAQPVLKVTGLNSTVITNASATPHTADGSDFGTIDMTNSVTGVTHAFNVANIGSASLSLSGTPVISLSGTGKAAFSIVAQPGATVASGSNENFSIKYSPTAVGTQQATVTITNNDPADVSNNKSFSFAIQGIAVSQPKLQILGAGNNPLTSGQTATGSTDGTDFGTADITAEGATHTFTIKNLNIAALTVTGVTVSDSDFTVTTQPAGTVNGTAVPHSAAPVPSPRHHHVRHHHHGVGSVASGSSTFAIQFTPSTDTVTAKTAVVTVTTNDPTNPTFTFTVTGTATDEPLMTVTGGNNNAAIASGNVTSVVANGTSFGTLDETQTATNTFTIANIGTDELDLTGGANAAVAISGANAGEFTVTQPASDALTTGQSSTFTVAFNPTAVGVQTAQLSIASGDPNSPYLINLQGTGQSVPIVGVTGNSIALVPAAAASLSNDTDFGNTELAQGVTTETYSIANSGSGDMNNISVTVGGTNHGDFSVSTAPASTSITSGSAAETFVVRFRPTAVGTRTATITVHSSDPATPAFTFNVQGEAVRQSVMQVIGAGSTAIADGDTTPASLDGTQFGSADATSGLVTHTFTIKNAGSDALNISDPVISGAGAAAYSVTVKPRVSLAAGVSTTFTVAFAPRSQGDLPGIVTITSNDANNTSYTFDVDGTGAAAPVAAITGGTNQTATIASGQTVPTSTNGTDFGAAVVGTSVLNTYTITDAGGAELDLSGNVTIAETGGGSDFAVTSQPGSTIAAGANSTFGITFTPSVSGVKTAVVTVASNDGSSPYTFTIRGTGITVPAMTVNENGTIIPPGDTSAIPDDGTDFGSCELNTGTISETFTITNNGAAALNLTNAAKVLVTGAGFSPVTPPATTVAANGGTTTFTVKYKPTALGTQTGTISIPSNDANTSPYLFDIQAEAVNAPVLSVLGGPTGHTISIVNGQITPLTANGTDIGSAVVNSGTVSQTFTIKNVGSAALNLLGTPLVEIDGASASDFTASTPAQTTLAAGATTTFTITFTPTGTGTETAVVSIASDDPNGGFSFGIQGESTTH